MVDQRRDRSRAELAGLDGDAHERKARVVRDAQAWGDVLRGRKRDDRAYLGYLTEGLGEARLVGDFTPAYGLLPEDRLRHMAGLWPKVRFVYLLRDPVMRIWSHCRMMAKRRANKPEEIQRRSVNIMKRVIKGKEPEIVRRSDYAGALQKLEAATSEDQLYVAFYEELFTRDAVGRLSRFLGIGHVWADFDKRVLEGPQASMEPGQWAEMRDFLADQYDAMTEMLGTVPETWGQEPLEV
jgi:hypothetical protein